MAEQLSWPAVLAWRVERQGLARRVPAAAWPELARRICGLHAQLHSSAELTLWARADGLATRFLDAPLWTERTLVKTWAMRGTLHLLDAGELAIFAGAQGALPPRYDSASWRKAFGMSAAEAEAVLDAIREALDGEPLTRGWAKPCAGAGERCPSSRRSAASCASRRHADARCASRARIAGSASGLPRRLAKRSPR